MSILAGYHHISIHVDELPSRVFRPTRKKNHFGEETFRHFIALATELQKPRESIPTDINSPA